MHWMAELAVERGYDQINSATANSLDLVAAAKDADSLGHLLYWEKVASITTWRAKPRR